MVVALLQAGADTSALNDDKVSPLSFAVQHGHQEVAVLLLDAGVSLSCKMPRIAEV